MFRLSDLLQKILPEQFKSRRYVLDAYQFELSSFKGDISEWLTKFPITDANSEMYFALGELFRRRGEFDKAVTVHEAIAKASLTNHTMAEVELEVAQDYYAAGLLGHAEKVLIHALEEADDHVARQAFRLWLTILESEQDWSGAVELVEKYGVSGSGGLRLVNLYCELAKTLLHEANSVEAFKVLKKAKRLRNGSRSELMLAELSTEQNNILDAINHYKDLIRRDPKRVDLVIAPLKHLSLMYGNSKQLLGFLDELYDVHPSIRLLEVVIDIYDRNGYVLSPRWQTQLELQVKTGRSYFIIEYWLNQNRSLSDEDRAVLKPALQQSTLVQNDVYHCTSCGFNSDQMVWRCPQCKSWETLYSDYELKTELKLNKSS